MSDKPNGRIERRLKRCAVCGKEFEGLVKTATCSKRCAQLKKSASLKVAWQDPAIREKHSAAGKEIWSRPEYRSAHCAMAKELWNRPERREEAAIRSRNRRSENDRRAIEEAVLKGLNRYLSETPCPRGHTGERYIGIKGNGRNHCVQCAMMGEWAKQNPERRREIGRNSAAHMHAQRVNATPELAELHMKINTARKLLREMAKHEK